MDVKYSSELFQRYIQRHCPQMMSVFQSDFMHHILDEMVYEFIRSGTDVYTDGVYCILKEDQSYHVQCCDVFETYTKKDFERFVVGYHILFSELLPLGTCVELDLNKLRERTDIFKGVDELLCVITQRFVASQDDASYFEYAGVLHPIGSIDQGNVFYFTEYLISNVRHKGYEDTKDFIFEKLMKEEMIVELGIFPYGLTHL